MSLWRQLFVAFMVTSAIAFMFVFQRSSTLGFNTIFEDAIMSQTPLASTPTIIIGGGIIGFSTAYYLAQNPDFGSSIHIVESAPWLFEGASGQATGVLGDYGFKPEAESLGILSFDLHKKLATEHDGRKNWGFNGIVIREMYPNGTSSLATKGALSPKRPIPSWFKDFGNYEEKIVADEQHAARLHAYSFCSWLKKECALMGVKILMNASVSRVYTAESNLASVDITEGTSSFNLPCKNLVISAGSWSGRVIRKLFPDSRVPLTLESSSDSRNHITIRTPGWKPSDDDYSSDQLYLEGILGKSLDISSYLGGTLYIGGYKSQSIPLPDSVTDVRGSPDELETMLNMAVQVLNVGADGLEIVDTGRAYRPFVKQGRPIIARVPMTHLLAGADPTSRNDAMEAGGVFLNVGHGGDGITLAPGSGKVMSELIMGLNTSADISGLGY